MTFFTCYKCKRAIPYFEERYQVLRFRGQKLRESLNLCRKCYK